MNSIFMVALNDSDPGNELILGFYPTRALAEQRKTAIESNPDYYAYGDIEENAGDTQVFIREFQGVTAEGLDTSFCLR